MFWLEEGLPSSLRPGARPRTTLCPGLALRDGKPYLAWGTPGGDQQEQWALHVFLRHVALGLDLQQAIDAPEFHTDHLISSFYPARLRAALRHGRVALRRRGRRGPAPPRPRGRGLGPVDARPRHRGRPRGGRPAQGRREPAGDAGLRGRAVTCPNGRASLSCRLHRVASRRSQRCAGRRLPDVPRSLARPWRARQDPAAGERRDGGLRARDPRLEPWTTETGSRAAMVAATARRRSAAASSASSSTSARPSDAEPSGCSAILGLRGPAAPPEASVRRRAAASASRPPQAAAGGARARRRSSTRSGRS